MRQKLKGWQQYRLLNKDFGGIEMSCGEIAKLAVGAIKYEPEVYLELLQEANYEEIMYLIEEFLAQE